MADLEQLDKDRFLQKSPDQTDSTKGAAYAAVNPTPKQGDTGSTKDGQATDSKEDDGAPNILTGTVIIACIIQTSALPSRIELQGNDLTFFDDTTTQAHKVIGDTSRLIFTHASGKEGDKILEGFIWEKRASRLDSYDNVLSLYALPPKQGKMNYLFFGFEGSGTQFNVNAIQMDVNHSTGPVTQDSGNGLFAVGGTIDGAIVTQPQFAVIWNGILGIPGDGYSIFMGPSGTGLVVVKGQVVPFLDDTYDLGDPSLRWRNLYVANLNVTEVGSAGSPVSAVWADRFSPGGNVGWTTGTGSPEGVVAAPRGSIYSNQTGGAGTSFYVKEAGNGNTGWVGK